VLHGPAQELREGDQPSPGSVDGFEELETGSQALSLIHVELLCGRRKAEDARRCSGLINERVKLLGADEAVEVLVRIGEAILQVNVELFHLGPAPVLHRSGEESDEVLSILKVFDVGPVRAGAFQDVHIVAVLGIALFRCAVKAVRATHGE